MNYRRQLLQASLATALLGPFARPALADRDDGDYKILQARYGTADRNVDVTPRLRELAREDRRVRITNDLFGADPAPGHRKTLRIIAQGPDGRTRTFDYEEFSHIDGNQFIGWGRGNWGHDNWNGGWNGDRRDPEVPRRNGDDGDYQILQARYGTSERNMDVTPRLRELARSDARVRITNDLFGADPDPGHRKTLRIYARGRGGDVRTFEYEEFSHIDGNQFTGWGGGNWGDSNWRGGWHGREERGNLRILRATYGASGRDWDITDRLRKLVRNGQSLEVYVDNQLGGGDPYPGQRKILILSYSFGNGPAQELRVEERETLRLP